ncbi:MAG: sugar ABC transporter permease [Anaerolineales bacterium]|nr:sugar ABC transporter permease [Anaerolineales bacterium]
MRDSEASKFLIGLVALIVGVFGVWIIYIVTDDLVSRLPIGIRERVQPFVFVGPAMVILAIYLIYPTIHTLLISFQDAKSENFVGLGNYIFALTDPKMLIVLRNNVLWLIFVTSFAVALGLVIAVMVDRIGRWEPVAKSLIFLPMAISAVGASVIWKFVYYYQPPGRNQTGLLNAMVVALGGGPVGWLLQRPWNNFFLIIVMVWLLTGFCMVVISSAVKGVPSELIEAARIDGATEIGTFFKITIPYIRGTLLTITTTVLIMVLKVFDLVFVMTSGQFGTEVLANRMYAEMFKFRNFGRGGSLAMILFVAVIPFIIYNIRSLREARR